MRFTLEKIANRLIDLVLYLVPGSRNNPASLESKVRRNWGTYDRARDSATQLLADAAAYQEKVEAEVKATADKAADAAEAAIKALEQRLKELDKFR